MTTHSILLIDDEEIVLDTVSDDLKEEGYQVVTAKNGTEGLQKFLSKPSDLVITDLVMQDMDGLEVFHEVKKVNPETSVLILTGYGTLQSAIEAFRLGACDYIVKPCKKEELTQRIASCLEMKEKQRKENLKPLSLILCQYCNKLKDQSMLESEEEVWLDFKTYLPIKLNCSISYETCPSCETTSSDD